MNAPSVARVRLALEVWLWRNGWAGVAAASLLIVSALTWALVVLPAQERRSELDARLSTLRSSAPQPRSTHAAVDPYELAWQRFRTELPEQAKANALFARILALARAQGVTLQQADFQHRHDAELGWLHVSTTMPIRGSYPMARRFLEAVLREQPNTALDEISFKRDASAASEPEMVARLSAWFRVEPGLLSGSDFDQGSPPRRSPGFSATSSGLKR